MVPHFLPAFILAFLGASPVMCLEAASGPDSSSCLLQNTHVLIDDSGVIHSENDVGMIRRHSHQEVSLFEMDSSVDSSVDSRVEVVSTMLLKAQTRCKQMQAHQFFMSRSTHGLQNHLLALAKDLATAKPKAKASVNKVIENAADSKVSLAKHSEVVAVDASAEIAETAKRGTPAEGLVGSTEKSDVQVDGTKSDAEMGGQAVVADKDAALMEKSDDEAVAETTAAPSDAAAATNADISKLVDTFITSQSGSDDACHSKLMETRHQLNQLHDILTTLLTEVNSTENSLILYDKELQEKLRELQEIEAWKDEELKKCQAKKEADIKMFETLTKELKEMKQIASPSTAMNLANGTLHTKSTGIQKRLSFLQEQVSHQSPRQTAIGVPQVPALVQNVQDAAHVFFACVAKYGAQSSLLQEAQAPMRQISERKPFKAGQAPMQQISEPKMEKTIDPMPPMPVLKPLKAQTRPLKVGQAPMQQISEPKTEKTIDPMPTTPVDPAGNTSASAAVPETPSSPSECKDQKEALEKTYVKAYVELARLTAEYAELSKSTACEDQVIATYEERAPALQEAAEKLSKLSTETAAKLKELRPRLDSATEADKKLRQQVRDLTEECENLPETISDLGKVRDAITALSLCPGLERPEFKMPRWIGNWVVFSQDAEKQSDEAQDKGMDWACSNANKGSRAAEASEIQERTILDMPVNNTGDFPLLGECTNCAGEEDATLKSGHARVCWFRGQPLNQDGKSVSCAKGRKVVMCVSDEASIRQIPGQ